MCSQVSQDSCRVGCGAWGRRGSGSSTDGSRAPWGTQEGAEGAVQPWRRGETQREKFQAQQKKKLLTGRSSMPKIEQVQVGEKRWAQGACGPLQECRGEAYFLRAAEGSCKVCPALFPQHCSSYPALLSLPTTSSVPPPPLLSLPSSSVPPSVLPSLPGSSVPSPPLLSIPSSPVLPPVLLSLPQLYCPSPTSSVPPQLLCPFPTSIVPPPALLTLPSFSVPPQPRLPFPSSPALSPWEIASHHWIMAPLLGCGPRFLCLMRPGACCVD